MNAMLKKVPLGMATAGSCRSPLIQAPVKIGVTDGKKTPKTEKKFSELTLVCNQGM